MSAPGQAREATLRAAGFDDSEVGAWRARTRATLSQGGFTPLEQDNYFGVREPDLQGWAGVAHQLSAALPPTKTANSDSIDRYSTSPKPGKPTGLEAIITAAGNATVEGFGDAPIGLTPEQEDALRGAGIINNYSQPSTNTTGKYLNEGLIRDVAAAGDTVYRGLGAVFAGAQAAIAQTGEELGNNPVGEALGLKALGRDVAAYIGTPEGMHASHPLPQIAEPFGTGARAARDIQAPDGGDGAGPPPGGSSGPPPPPISAAAVGQHLRGTMMQAYADGTVTNSADFFNRVGGQAAADAAAAHPNGFPDPAEFGAAARVITGGETFGALPAKLRTIYAKTGVRPAAVAADAATDPGLRHDLASSDVIVPERYMRPPEASLGLLQPPSQSVTVDDVSQFTRDGSVQLPEVRSSAQAPLGSEPALESLGLPELQARLHEELAQNPSADRRTEIEGQLQELRQRLPPAGQTGAEAVRKMRGRQGSNAPRGLQQAAGRDLVVSGLPHERTSTVATRQFVEGPAGEAVPQAGDQTPISVSIKPSATGPVRRPSDLVKWLARKGGLRTDDPEHAGDLRGMGAHEQFVPGAGMLVRKSGGMGLDRAREMATEAGYGPYETTSDLLDGIDNALRGGDEFSQNDMDQVVRWKEQDSARRAGPAPDAEQAATDQIKELRNRADALGVEHDDTWTAEDLLAGVIEREATREDAEGTQAHLDAAELDLDRYIAKQYPHLTGELARNGYDSDIPFGSEHETPARPTQGGGQHEVAPGGSAGDGNAGAGPGGGRGGAAEGRQLVLPGGERSAGQLAAGRDAAGHGRVATAVDQRAADEGLFAAPAADEPTLFMQRDGVAQTETPEFKTWFGDSKVVDDAGKPLRVYHASADDISEFKTRGIGDPDQFPLDAAFFSSTPDYPNRHIGSEPGGNVVSAYLSIKNPLYVTLESDDFANPMAEQEHIITARATGRDGVIFSNKDGPEKFFAAFEPEQIKSATGNRGTFDPNNPNINAMQRGAGGDAPIRAARDMPIKRGAQAILDRLRMQANLEKARIKRTGSGTPLDAADIREVEDFISFVGEKMFDDVGLRIRADQGPQGQYETASRIVTIFRRAIEYGQLTRTAIHELWHSLDRALSPKDRQAVYNEFQRAQYDWLLKNPWAEPFLDGRGDLRNELTGHEATQWLNQFGDEKTPVVASKIPGELRNDKVRFPWDEENYRFTNVDEYFAETMTDKYRDFADMKDARARSIFAHVRDIWDHMVASFKRLFGGDATGRIFEGFGKGAYEPPAGPRQPGAVYFSDYTPAEQAVLDRIVSKPETKRPFSLEQLYTDVIDDLNPVKVMERTLAGEKPLETKDSPYALMRLFRGTPGRVEQFLERSPFKFDTLENVGKSLKDILRPVRNDLDGLRAYIASRRAVELADRDIVTGIPRAAAEQVIADGDARYAEITQDLHDYQRNLLDYLRDSGVLGDEAYRKIIAANEDYVPFYRLMGEDEGRGGPSAKGKVKNPVKTIKGSERQIIDPLESIVRNTDLYIKLAEKNRALTSLVNLAAEHELGDDFLKRVPTQTAPIKITDAEAAAFLKDQGINAENPEGFTVFRPKPFQPSRDEIAIFREGKREVYRVERDLADAVDKMDPESLPWYIGLLAAPARALRAGATLIPDFILRNFLRDNITANSLSNYKMVPFYDAVRGLGSVLKKDADYQSWLKGGGANGAMVSLDRRYMEDNIFGLARQTGMLDRVVNVIKTPFEMLRIASEIAENATRIGAFKRAMSATGDAYASAFESREVTLDFARIGAKMRAVNAIVAFSNAGIQGVDRVVRAFKENPLGTTARTIAAITVPSVLLWYANHDDPRYKGLPQWERDLFWIVMTKDHIYRIPKPFELGIVFGTIPEHALDAFHDKNPDAFKGVTGTVLNGLMPNYIPTFALPVVETFANRSTFTGNKLVPASMEGILPEYQYTNYTTNTAKLLGRFVAIMPGMKQSQFASPIILENYLRAWSGGLGMYALQTSDLALRKAGVIDPPPAPAPTLADTPFIKAFIVRYPSASDQRIQDFYDRYTTSQQALDTISALARRGEPDAAMRELRVQQASDTLVRLSGLQKGLMNIEKEIRMITIMPNMAPAEKRQMIDGLYYSMIQGADMGNKMLDQVDAIREGRQVAPIPAGQ